MNKRNYQKELEKIINDPEVQKKAPKLFLHSCCAPCSSYVLEYLSKYFRITVFYYNPNIWPAEEFSKRSGEEQRFIAEFPAGNPVSFIEGHYDQDEFYKAVEGMEDMPEGMARCDRCFRLRLKETIEMAENLGFDYVCSTLTLSPLKNTAHINAIGEELTEGLQIKWLPSDFKKKDGYKRSIELSQEYGLYRQDYCGCEFSRRRDFKGFPKE